MANDRNSAESKKEYVDRSCSWTDINLSFFCSVFIDITELKLQKDKTNKPPKQKKCQWTSVDGKECQKAGSRQ